MKLMVKFWPILSCFVCLRWNLARGSFQTIPNLRVDSEEEVLRKWKAMDEKINSGMETLLKTILPSALRLTSELDLTPECTTSLLKVLFGARELKLWAIKMLDATGKPGAGLLSGTLSSFGDYKQCLSLEVPDNFGSSKDNLLFRGQYCMIDLRPSMPKKPDVLYAKTVFPVFENFTGTSELMNELTKRMWGFYSAGLRYGVCVPSTCSMDDIDQIATKVSSLMELYSDVVSCETKNSELEIDSIQLAIITVLISILAIVIIATVIDLCIVYQKRDTKELAKTLGVRLSEALSIRSNWQKMFQDSKNDDQTLACLNGIRFLSITWVVLGHTYLFVDYQLIRNTFSIWDEITHTFSFQIIGNGFLSVESFLFVTGMLISYNLVKYYDSKGPRIFNIPIIILHRIWRLLPSTMLVVGLTILLPLIGSGPMWDDVAGGLSRNCKNHWWKLLVFANNFTPFKDQCLPQTWYIAVDFQLFFVALLFMFIYFKNPIMGTVFNIVAAVAGIMGAGLMTYLKQYPPGTITAVADKIAIDDITNHTYFLPHVHLGVYCIGLSLGAFLARCGSVKVPKMVQIIGWTCSFALNTTILFIVQKWNYGVKATLTESVVYACLHRTGWGVGLAWLAFMCATGHGGYINDLLSWKGYTVLNRLTYLVYLLHVTVFGYLIGSMTGNIDSTHIISTWAFLGNLVVSHLVAFVLRLLFEAPVLELEVIFFRYVLGISGDKSQNRDGKTGEEHRLENGRRHSNVSHPDEISRRQSDASMAEQISSRL